MDCSEVAESSPVAAKPSTERTERVRAFFDVPHRYLEGNRALAVRGRFVAELAGEVRGHRIIDLGCGDGTLTRQFVDRGAHLTLVDTSFRMLELARDGIAADRAESVSYLNVDLLDVPDQQYELVVCVGVLAHVGSVEDSLAKVARLTTPGGRCILQLTDQGHPAGRLLHICHTARIARRPSGYRLNRLSLAATIDSAACYGLSPAARRRYFFVPPGLGRLPSRWLVEIERRLDGPSLRRLGSEVVIAFVKDGGTRPGARSPSPRRSGTDGRRE